MERVRRREPTASDARAASHAPAPRSRRDRRKSTVSPGVLRPRRTVADISSPRSRSSRARTASIAPGRQSCIRRARRATRRSASSRAKTPARHAATYSPRLWPIIAAGCMPQVIHSRASAYSMTNSAGWVTGSVSMRAARPPPASGGGIEDRAQVSPEIGLSTSQAFVDLPRNTGSDCVERRDPCRRAALPGPGNMNATPAGRSLALPVTTRSIGLASSFERLVAVAGTASARRCSNARATDLQGDRLRRRGRRPVLARDGRADARVAASSAGRGPRREHQELRARAAGGRRAAGASSSTTWALVPPDAERADASAPRVRPPASHGRSVVLTKKGVSSRSSFGFGASKCSVGGITPVMEGQNGLDEAGDAGRRIEMADVGLERSRSRRMPVRVAPPDRKAWVSAGNFDRDRRAACPCRGPRRRRSCRDRCRPAPAPSRSPGLAVDARSGEADFGEPSLLRAAP